VTVAISFSVQKATYPVTFSESGLSTGITWSLALNGTLGSGSSGSNISFLEPNGTYTFSLAGLTDANQTTVRGYAGSPSTGTVTVRGVAQQVTITFSRIIYTLSFIESGLASGTNWSVTVNGSAQSSTSATIAFRETSGTYRYVVGTVTGYNLSGRNPAYVNVSGQNRTINLTFQASNGSGLTPLSFSASGLAVGASWSVALTASTAGLRINVLLSVVRTATAPNRIAFEVSPGSYAYVSSSSGYLLVAGNVTISGPAPRSLELGFVASPQGPPTRSLPEVLELSGWGGAIGVAIAIVGASGLAWTVVRTRQTRRERGRTLVSGILTTEWTTDRDGEPEVRAKR
jgi:hypothetical protein